MHLHLQTLVSQLSEGACPDPQTALVQIDHEHPILTQIDQAFSKRPDPSGIIHGVRKVRRGCRGRRTSIFTSVKSGASFLLESGPELDYALLLEHDPSVESFRTQAIEIDLPGEGYAFPDFVVRTNEGYEVHEVKPTLKAIDVRMQKRFKIMQRELEVCDVGFKLVFADTFPTASTLHRLSSAYSRGHAIRFTKLETTRAAQLLRDQDIRTERDAYRCLLDENMSPAIADFLWFHGRLEFESSGLNYANKEKV